MSRSRSDVLSSGAPSFDSLSPGMAGACDAANQQSWDSFVGPPGVELDTAAEQTRWLSRTIETEIIPRLMLAHRADALAPLQQPAAAAAPTERQVAEFTLLTLGSQADLTLAYVRALRQTGVSLEAIYLDLLAPAARRLGALWETDHCSFSEVTMGLWRLQQVMHELGPAFQASVPFAVEQKRAILVPVPGSQHTMGLFMVAEFFRRAGWDVWGDALSTAKEIVAATRAEWFDLVGLSVGSETHFPALASVILEIRKASRNRGLLVIIGGPIVASTPDLVSRVGADASAADAPQAVLQAEVLLAARPAMP